MKVNISISVHISRFEQDPQNLIISADGVRIKDLYWSTEQKCRKYFQRGLYYILFNQVTFAVSFIYSIHMILTNSFDASKLLLPFKMSVPFDPSTLWGWYLIWLLQFNTGLAYICSTVPITVYFMCCCTYIAAICHHFDSLIKSIKVDVENSQNETNSPKYYKLCLNIRRKFHKSISIHNTAFE